MRDHLREMRNLRSNQRKWSGRRDGALFAYPAPTARRHSPRSSGRNQPHNAVFTINTMIKIAISSFAACILLLAGCNKSSAVKSGDADTQVTDWGVVEVTASTPTHLQLEGKDCTLTATPLADGKF